MVRKSLIVATSSIGAGALLLAGCSSSSSSSDTEGAAAAVSASAAESSCPLTASDAWVKAADSGMTAAFGQVSNPTDQAVTITAATTPAAATTELHDTVEVDGSPTMQQVESFEVPPQGSLTLQPGGSHLMLMQIPAPIQAGEDVAVTLTCGDAGTMQFVAQARSYAGANESYEPGGQSSESDSSGMDMS